MPNDKQVKFVFSIDQNSVSRLNQALQNITRNAQQAMAAMTQATGGLGQPGMPLQSVTSGAMGISQIKTQPIRPQVGGQNFQSSLMQYVQANKSAIDKIVESGKGANKTLAEVLKTTLRGAAEEMRRLGNETKEFERKLESLNQGRKSIANSILPPGQMSILMGASSQAIANASQGYLQAQIAQQRNQQLIAQVSPQYQAALGQTPGGGGAAAGGGGGGNFFTFGAFGGGAMRAAAGLMGAANFGINEALAGSRGFAASEAQRVGVLQPTFGKIMGGDLKLLIALDRTRRDAQSRADMQAQVQSISADAEQTRNALGQTAGAIGSALPIIGGLFGRGGSAGGGGALEGWQVYNQDTSKMKNLLAQAEAKSQGMNLLEQQALGQFQGEMGQRVSAQRMFGYGLFNDVRGDTYGDLRDRLMGQGYDPGQYMSARAGLRQMAGGRFAGRAAYSAMAAQAAGYGGYDQLLAAGARSGTGMRFAQAATGAGDISAGIQLGQTVLGGGFDPMGTTSGMGVIGAAQWGMRGGPEDFNYVQRVGAGMGMLNQLTTGGADPYQRGRNLVSAIGANPNLGIYGQDYLANGMNFRQMADIGYGRSQMTATGKALGITDTMVRQQLQSNVSSYLDRYVGGAETPMGRIIQQFRASGKGDLSGWLQSIKNLNQRQEAVQNIGAFYGLETGMGEEAGIGGISLMAGLGAQARTRGGVGGALTGVEGQYMKDMAAASAQATAALKGLAGQILQSSKERGGAVGALAAASDLNATSESLLKSFAKLDTAVENLTKKLQYLETNIPRKAWR